MSQDFFLSPDDAKSFGDIGFMRKKQSIRKTYPKGKRASEIVEASSLEMRRGPEDIRGQSSFPSVPQATTPTETSTPTPPSRRPNTSNTGGLDFGAMARGMKKK